MAPVPVWANVVTGELRVWHRVSVTFDGPQTNESAAQNPFTDYRLIVTFTHASSGASYAVPGFYAADGNAGETSATSGNKWRVHFTPDREGVWTYVASFRTGAFVAVDLAAGAGTATSFNGASGTFTVAASDKPETDFRRKGMLRYAGQHYYQFAGTGEYFIKVSPNTPENLLAFADFDGTYDTDCAGEGIDNTLHTFAPHAADWKTGDPVWKGSKGKGLIGGINYLSSVGVNNLYFLTYNLDAGDGCDVWPWTSHTERARFDVSKLDQWERVFSHMDARGLQLHVVLTERENAKALGPPGAADNNNLNDIRKLYYRELVARFGHHLAVQWNIGEENTNGDNLKIAFAEYIRAVDPYDHPITVHTSDSKSYTFYEAMLGDPNFEATSLQGDHLAYNELAQYYREQSEQAGRPWAVYGDEQSPNAGNTRADELRKGGLWGMLMGGGAGVEWFTTDDLTLEDWRSYDLLLEQMGHARAFFDTYLPFEDMEAANELTPATDDYVFALTGQRYVVYLPNGGASSITLAGATTTYSVSWYDPRNGGPLKNGTVTQVSGGGAVSIGAPPSPANTDWVALVEATSGGVGTGPVVVSVTAVDALAHEPGGGDNLGRFRFDRTGNLDAPLSITYSLGGSASLGVDYEPLPATIVIDAGKASKKVSVDAIDDLIVESDETVVLTISAHSGYSVDPGAASATITLVDNDSSTPSLLGDPSQNGSVSALDASLILQHVAGDVTLSGAAFVAGDVSGNGEISAYDASLILQYLVGIFPCFPADPTCATSGN
ncbi:MAG: DUF5060 domain-containing protein [Rhodothermales bacterium]